MIKNFRLFYIIPFLSVLALWSCSKDDDDNINNPPIDPFAEISLPDTLFNYANIELPEYFLNSGFPSQFQFQAITEYDNTPADNPITDEGATLGRVLFYDKKLSANGTVACASCHEAEHGFSDPDVLSEGFDGGLTRRHSMGIVNADFMLEGNSFGMKERKL